MKRQITLALFAFMFIMCLASSVADGGKLSGVWINSGDEGYYQLTVDLGGKHYKLTDGGAKCHGYLQMENDFVSDYLIITDAEQLLTNTYSVKYYSLRYGMPDQIETANIVYSPETGTVKFGDAYTFTADMACKYVEMVVANTNILLAPVNGTILMKAGLGMMFAYDGLERGWYRIRLGDGRTAYMPSSKAAAATKCEVPADAFNATGYITDVDGKGQTAVSFGKSGDVVSMYMEYSTVTDIEKSLPRWLYTTKYSGRVEGNRLVFDRKVQYGVGSFELAEATPDQMEAIEPYTVYYSPTNACFIIDGKPLVPSGTN